MTNVEKEILTKENIINDLKSILIKEIIKSLSLLPPFSASYHKNKITATLYQDYGYSLVEAAGI